ncbi:MAG: winged helix-turn-helix domain-containing protein [Candidatus Thorarchaeota archaeon]
MSDDEVFDAISHSTRVEILRILAVRPTRFADLKRKLKIDSSGLLDFHLKKMQDIITTNQNGDYALNYKGYAALQAVDVVSKYGWQRRAYILNVVVYVIMNVYFFAIFWTGIPFHIYIIIPLVTTAWIVFYSYWSLVKRKVHLQREKVQD